jgi:isocitrate/isopropylmalate dehydrogenase
MDKIGLVIGGGTGRELGEVFKQALLRITSLIKKKVQIIECKHEFKTYNQLKLIPKLSQIKEIVYEDLKALYVFYKEFYHLGGRVIFRTAINAETLYAFRRIGKAVKIIQIPVHSKTLLIVRDEMQGFYTNDEYQLGEHEIYWTSSISEENCQIIMTFALKEAKRLLQKPFDVWVTYKHHLFANLIEAWYRKAFNQVKVYQPNHVTDLLFQYIHSINGNDLLLITGNEIGDILHEVLIYHLGIGTRNTLYSKNIYLHPDFQGLTEYQTVHGSADSLAGRGKVNPFATLRIVGAIIEEWLDEPGFSKKMDDALQQAESAGIVTPDMGGNSSTDEVVEYVLANICLGFKAVSGGKSNGT